MYDNHLHSSYSKDSRATPEGLIRAGKDAGLAGIVFTDHYDTGFPGINTDNIVPAKYAECAELCMLRSADGFGVLRGIELSPMKHTLPRVIKEMSEAKFDYVILAAHFLFDVPQTEFLEYYDRHSKKNTYDAYLRSLIELVSLYEDFDTLGHFDYISRYAPYNDTVMRYREQSEALDELFLALIKMGRTLEINTGSYVRFGKRHEFDEDILIRYKELGGELICLGSDSHRNGEVGRGFGEFRDILIRCGFHAVVHYVERKPVFENL